MLYLDRDPLATAFAQVALASVAVELLFASVTGQFLLHIALL